MKADKNNIKRLIEEGESESLELKPSLSQIKEIIQTIAGFANKNGGKIIIGVSSMGKILSLQIGNDTIEKLTNRISAGLEPKIYPKIEVREIDRKKIIIIEVKKSREKPVFAFGRAFKRVGKSTLRMSKDETERLILARKKIYWDGQICEAATLKDIDKRKVKEFLIKAKKERRLKIDPNINLKEALTRLNLLKDNKLTNTTILMFGREPQKFLLQSEVRCAKFKGTFPAKPFIDMKIIESTIDEQIDLVEKFIMNNIKKSAWLVPGQVKRIEKWEYPLDALREAVTNAICHRDYSSSSNVQVRIFDNRIEVWNPGNLPEGWTVETLKKKHESKPKNPLIAKLFFMIKNIEQWGTGTNEMIRETVKHGLPEPVFEDTKTSIIVTFKKSLFEEEYLEGLNERQKKAIEYLKEHGKIDRRTYCQICNVEKTVAYEELSNMLGKGIINSVGKGRATQYILRT